MTIYEQNTAKIKELTPVAQWSAQKAMEDCFAQGYEFRISETYRSQERQKKLYNQPWDNIDNDRDGRIDEPDEQVTWTLDSDHTKRLAIDLYPINCTHEQIAPIFAKWGITHPWPSADPPHYSCASTQSLLAARLGFYIQSVGRIANPLRKAVVQRAIDRIRGLIS